MNQHLIELTSEIVAAYVGKNPVQQADLPALINSVYHALGKAAHGAVEEPQEELQPAVPVRKSLSPDHIVCLEDGKRFKSLKRHLRAEHDLSPDEYRARWGLPPDYPMVAPDYAATRSELAKKMGLGQAGQQAARQARAGQKKRT